MNEKDFMVKLAEKWVEGANTSLTHSRKISMENYRKLESEYQKTIFDLEFSVKEAQINRENIGAKATKKEILLADAAIEKAQKALVFGSIKAKSDLEIGYLNLNLEVKNKISNVAKEELFLEFAREEQARGFTL